MSQRNLRRARDCLLNAWHLQPDLPEAATDLVRVTGLIGGIKEETHRFWFDEAVAAQFDHVPAYQYEARALLPQLPRPNRVPRRHPAFRRGHWRVAAALVRDDRAVP